MWLFNFSLCLLFVCFPLLLAHPDALEGHLSTLLSLECTLYPSGFVRTSLEVTPSPQSSLCVLSSFSFVSTGSAAPSHIWSLVRSLPEYLCALELCSVCSMAIPSTCSRLWIFLGPLDLSLDLLVILVVLVPCLNWRCPIPVTDSTIHQLGRVMVLHRVIFIFQSMGEIKVFKSHTALALPLSPDRITVNNQLSSLFNGIISTVDASSQVSYPSYMCLKWDQSTIKYRHVRTQFIYKDIYKYIGLVCMTKPLKQSSDTVFYILKTKTLYTGIACGSSGSPSRFL